MEKNNKQFKEFQSLLAKGNKSEEDILAQIRDERAIGDIYVMQERIEILADIELLRNRKQNREKIGDTTTYSVVKNLTARMYQNKSPLNISNNKNGSERKTKMLKEVWKKDSNTSYMKALRYYRKKNVNTYGLAITAKLGWDGDKKMNIFENINPLLAVPDPYGDYFLGNYSFIGFSQIYTRQELINCGYSEDEVDNLCEGETTQGAIQQLRDKQSKEHYTNLNNNNIVELYLHFFIVGNYKVWALVGNSGATLLNAGVVQAGCKEEEDNRELIKFPFAFEYFDPIDGTFFGDRPANYTRDPQIVKSTIANLRLDKMKAELYPMYVYNKSFINGKDLDFGFNRKIPVDTKLNGNIPLQNLISPIQKDLRIDTSIAVEQLIDRQVEKSTAIGEVAQGTTPQSRETATTNSLVQSNLDVLVAMNEEIANIGEQQLIELWLSGYFQNFESGDRKLIYAASSTGEIPLYLKKNDFLNYTTFLDLSIENNVQIAQKKQREAIAYTQTIDLVLSNQQINEASKRMALRKNADKNGIDMNEIELIIPKTVQQLLQMTENELLIKGINLPINADDNDEEHLVEMGDILTTEEAELHKQAHIEAIIFKNQNVGGGQAVGEGVNQGMLNSINNVNMQEASREKASLQMF